MYSLKFIKENKLKSAISTNLTLISYIHQKVFGFCPEPVSSLLETLGYNNFELNKIYLIANSIYLIFYLQKLFGIHFLNKLYDPFASLSLLNQILHMLNPFFFCRCIKTVLSIGSANMELITKNRIS